MKKDKKGGAVKEAKRQKRTKGKPKPSNQNTASPIKLIKSPSEPSTIYALVCNKIPNVTPSASPMARRGCNPLEEEQVRNRDMITEFIKRIRLEESQKYANIVGRKEKDIQSRQPSPKKCDSPGKTDDQLAKEYADRAIIDAEKFRASVAIPPKGMNLQYLSRSHDDDDDDFFDMTCHVEKSLREKNRKGGIRRVRASFGQNIERDET